MKKCWILIVVLLMLTGCGSVETFETLGSIPHQPSSKPVEQKVSVQLPKDAAEQTGEDNGTMYLCDDYTILMQTLASGDMNATIRTLSGYSQDQLMVMESGTEKVRRYDWVWTSVGEEGDIVCRATVLDDGNYHYCLCTMANAEASGGLTEEWNDLFGSFRLE